jgi:hypothetical protein
MAVSAIIWESGHAKNANKRGQYVPVFDTLRRASAHNVSAYQSAVLRAWELGERGAEAKRALKPLKLGLPIFRLPSGYYQLDLDLPFAPESVPIARAMKAEILRKGERVPYCAISPTMTGIKVYLKYHNDTEFVSAAKRLAVIFRKKWPASGFDIDLKARNGDCLFTGDKDAHINPNAPFLDAPAIPHRKPETPAPKPTWELPALMQGREFVDKAIARASRNAARDGALNSHAGRTSYALFCYLYGLTCEQAYTLAPAPLDVEFRAFQTRWACMYRNAKTAGKEGSLAHEIR